VAAPDEVELAFGYRDDPVPTRTTRHAAPAAARSGTGGRPRSVYYGWRIVGVAFLTHCLNVGCVFYSFGVFFTPLITEFGWTRAQISWGFSSVSIVGALWSPLVGRIVDRYGPRPSQLFGALVLGGTFMALSTVHSLGQYYALMALFVSLGSTTLGPIPSNSAVAGWFLRRRGRALGFATAGISMGGVIFVPLAQALIARLGWRQAFVALGAVVIGAALGPIALFMRKPPAELPPDERMPAGDGDGLAYEIEHSATAAEAVRDPNFWLIASAFSLTVMGLSAILLHQVPLLIDFGVTPAHAALALGATAGVGVVGKLGFGALLERVEQRRVIVGCFLAQAAGLLLLPFARTPVLLVLYVLVYGYAMGGNATLQATILGDCFGRRHYGAIAGRMSPIIVFSQAVAVPLVGWLRDRTGSYLPAIAAIEVMVLAAAFCISRLRPPAWRRSA
jgi:MFS family permease